jgi:hypothetical protein
MGIIYKGQPPFALPIAQSAEARAVGETVELTVLVIAPEQGPIPFPVRVPLPLEVARGVASQMQPCIVTAEVNARRKRP